MRKDGDVELRGLGQAPSEGHTSTQTATRRASRR